MDTVQKRAIQNDQLGFFLFLALALHAIVILGVGFTAENNRYDAPPQLEVTLARYSQGQAPEDAQFIAQANQMGSGTQSLRSEITSQETAEFSDNRIRETSAVSVVSPPTASDSITSLEARLDQQQQAFAQRPKVHRLTSLSAKQSVDAVYLHRWRTRVEAVGNRHYPVVSSRYGIYGDLRLLVAIRQDGSIEDIAVLASSGHAVLDQAAIRIVKMAAPFDAFPTELRAKADRLEIIRTWKFKQNRLSSVQG